MSTTNYTSQDFQTPGAQNVTTVYTPNPPAQDASPTAITPPVTPTPPVTAPKVDPSQPFNASAVQKTTPVTYPNPVTSNTTSTNAQLGATTNGQGITAASTLAADQTTTTPTTPTNTDRTSALNSILDIFKKQQNQGADTIQANKDNDVAGKQQKVTDLTNQLASKTAAWDAQIQNAQKNLGGGGQAGVDAQVAQLTQQKNQDLANISIQLNAANGNYTTAAAIAKETVDAKYAPLKDQLATLQQYYTLSKNDMTDSEQQQSEAAIQAKQAEINHGYSRDLAAYNEQLQENDPLHAAQVAQAWANVTKTNNENALTSTPTGTTGQYQGALSVILGSNKFTKDQKQAVLTAVNSGQDPVAVLKNQAKQVMGQTEATKVTGFEVARDNIADIKTALAQYYANGGKTNIFNGTTEQVINNLGAVKDPKLVGLATQISAAIQQYRNAVSGTAYSVQEGKQIDSVFPGINKTQGLNDAILAGREAAFNSTIDASYRTVLGSTYDTLKNDSKTPEDVGTKSVIPPAQIPAGYYQASDGLLYKK